MHACVTRQRGDSPSSVWQLHVSSKVVAFEPQQPTSKLVLVIAVPEVDSAVAVPCITVSTL